MEKSDFDGMTDMLWVFVNQMSFSIYKLGWQIFAKHLTMGKYFGIR
jgi:hypothetical protein